MSYRNKVLAISAGTENCEYKAITSKHYKHLNVLVMMAVGIKFSCFIVFFFVLVFVCFVFFRGRYIQEKQQQNCQLALLVLQCSTGRCWGEMDLFLLSPPHVICHAESGKQHSAFFSKMLRIVLSVKGSLLQAVSNPFLISFLTVKEMVCKEGTDVNSLLSILSNFFRKFSC